MGDQMRPGANVIRITRPMNGARRVRPQPSCCVIKITAPIDSFLYTCGTAEGNGLLATQEVAMETNFGAREINMLIELGDAELDSVSGGRGFVPPGKRFHSGDKDDDDLSDLEIQR
jgi:hypothetical protein